MARSSVFREGQERPGTGQRGHLSAQPEILDAIMADARLSGRFPRPRPSGNVQRRGFRRLFHRYRPARDAWLAPTRNSPASSPGRPPFSIVMAFSMSTAAIPTEPEDLVWTDHAREAVLALNDAGHLVFVVTNQAGVAHGYYEERQVHAFHAAWRAGWPKSAPMSTPSITARSTRTASSRAIVIRHTRPQAEPRHDPKARHEWSVRDEGSFLIGDMPSDMEAARRAGLRGMGSWAAACFAGSEETLRSETWRGASAPLASCFMQQAMSTG